MMISQTPINGLDAYIVYFICHYRFLGKTDDLAINSTIALPSIYYSECGHSRFKRLILENFLTFVIGRP